MHYLAVELFSFCVSLQTKIFTFDASVSNHNNRILPRWSCEKNIAMSIFCESKSRNSSGNEQGHKVVVSNKVAIIIFNKYYKIFFEDSVK